MPREGYKSISIRESTHAVLAEDKADSATWDEYLLELHESMEWALDEQADARDAERREFSVRAEAAGPTGDIVLADLTDAERERLLDGIETRIRELRGETY